MLAFTEGEGANLTDSMLYTSIKTSGWTVQVEICFQRREGERERERVRARERKVAEIYK